MIEYIQAYWPWLLVVWLILGVLTCVKLAIFDIGRKVWYKKPYNRGKKVEIVGIIDQYNAKIKIKGEGEPVEVCCCYLFELEE